MFIDRLEQFYTDQEREELQKIDKKQAFFYSARTNSPELTEDQRKQIIDEFDSAAIMQTMELIVNRAKNRYFQSFNGDINSIVADANKIIQTVDKETFSDNIRRREKAFAPILTRMSQKDINAEVAKAYEQLEASTKANFYNFCRFIHMQISLQLEAIAFYSNKDELQGQCEKARQQIFSSINAKAGTYYKTPHTLYYMEPQKDALTAFFNGIIPFATVARPPYIECFLGINDESPIKDAPTARYFKNCTITFTGRLGIEEQKIAELLRMQFTNSNYHTASKNLKTFVEIPLTATMNILGRTINQNNKKAYVRRLNNIVLPNIAHAGIKFERNTKNKIDAATIEIGSTYGASLSSDKIIFEFNERYAKYLNTKSLSQYYINTLKLGTDKNPLPYYLAIKLQDHYFKDANRARGTNMILSVKSILNFCEDTLQYEYILETDPTHWKRKIKDRLEKALNEIQQQNIFHWEYCGAQKTKIPQEEADSADFNKWAGLYITFRLIPEEPDQSERLLNKQKRIETAKAKKDMEASRPKKTKKGNDGALVG